MQTARVTHFKILRKRTTRLNYPCQIQLLLAEQHAMDASHSEIFRRRLEKKILAPVRWQIGISTTKNAILFNAATYN